VEVNGQFHTPVAFPPGKESPDTHWVGGWARFPHQNSVWISCLSHPSHITRPS